MEGVTDGENEGDDCDEVTYVGWGEPGESEHNEVDGMKKGVDSKGEEMHIGLHASIYRKR